ncbi:GTA-gp10 family protein [Sphingobium sp.]|uniref:GTA-gp10 family protein n=1 Tax=Sphingobium sp. TaxID=1912891 RepID=UPI003BB6277B
MTDETTRPVAQERGELTLLLDGADMGLRPSYEAIQAIETSLGRGLVDLARDGIAGKLSMSETAQIATECIRAWGRDVEDKGAAGANAVRIAKLILDSDGGIYAAQKTVSAMLSLAVTGGYNSSGELKPSMTTEMTGSAPVDG